MAAPFFSATQRRRSALGSRPRPPSLLRWRWGAGARSTPLRSRSFFRFPLAQNKDKWEGIPQTGGRCRPG